MVRDTCWTQRRPDINYQWVSIGIMTFDLGWPWTVLDVGYRICIKYFEYGEKMQCWTQWKPPMGFRSALYNMTLDDLELPWFKIIRITLIYFENGDRYDNSVNGNGIENRPRAIYWHHDHWPWMTLIFRWGVLFPEYLKTDSKKYE